MNATELKNAFQKQKVLVIGDLMVDSYLFGTVERISPEAPVPVVLQQKTETRLGGAANVAINLKALHAQVALIGIVGKDDFGTKTIPKLLDEQQIDAVHLIESTSRPTTVKQRIIAQGNHLLRVDFEATNNLNDKEFDHFAKAFTKVLTEFQPNYILLQDYNKGMLSKQVIQHVLYASAKLNIPIAVDPKKTNFWEYKNVDLFKPNLKEINDACADRVSVNNELSAKIEYLLEQVNPRSIMITLSAKGIMYVDAKNSGIEPTTSRQIVDVCGAGDAVFAVAALGRAIGLDLEAIAKLGNLCGGQVCERVGVATIDWTQLAYEWESMSDT